MKGLKKISIFICTIFMLFFSMNIAEGNCVKAAESTIKPILSVVPNNNNVFLEDTIRVELNIDNVTNVVAEDIIIKYDSTKLTLTGFNKMDGLKADKCSNTPGELRIVLYSDGTSNTINAKKLLMRLYFKAIAPGNSEITVQGKISDGINVDRQLTDEECLNTTINIAEKQLTSVDADDDEFTLLDLAIDARHYGEDPDSLRPEYETDVVRNDKIDDDDLKKIAEFVVANPNYEGNMD